MTPWNSRAVTSLNIEEPDGLFEEADCMSKILDAKYPKADWESAAVKAKQVTAEQVEHLKNILKRHETLFDGALGRFKNTEYHIELKQDAKPNHYHPKPFAVPKAYKTTLQQEVKQLCAVGILKKVNCSKWAAPTLIIPKKDGTVNSINQFRKLNKRIKLKPCLIPKIQDLLLKLEGFQ